MTLRKLQESAECFFCRQHFFSEDKVFSDRFWHASLAGAQQRAMRLRGGSGAAEKKQG
jgi:hypothetical protein